LGLRPYVLGHKNQNPARTKKSTLTEAVSPAQSS
jgi:hypothetical protein